jgi:hypothetical protein
MPEGPARPTSKTRDELEERLIVKAYKDAKFRAELAADPKGTIARELKITIPDSIKIFVHQETSTDFHLVLPDVSHPGELSDVELQAVAGAGDKYNVSDACRKAVGGTRG